MLKPLGIIRTTITEIKKNIEFCQTSSCQAHHNVRSLLMSPNWHLSVCLKAYAVYVPEVLVLPCDIPSEVILDLCHVCKIIMLGIWRELLREICVVLHKKICCLIFRVPPLLVLSTTMIMPTPEFKELSHTVPWKSLHWWGPPDLVCDRVTQG